VLVRNVGTAPAAPSQLRSMISRPGTGQTAADTRSLTLAELGPSRIEAVADAASVLTESNKGNNAKALEIGSVPALCRN
jgi:hypothetical protein